MAKGAMCSIGLEWNPKKCNVLHVKRGRRAVKWAIWTSNPSRIPRFPGMSEQVRQDEKLALECAVSSYLTLHMPCHCV